MHALFGAHVPAAILGMYVWTSRRQNAADALRNAIERRRNKLQRTEGESRDVEVEEEREDITSALRKAAERRQLEQDERDGQGLAQA